MKTVAVFLFLVFGLLAISPKLTSAQRIFEGCYDESGRLKPQFESSPLCAQAAENETQSTSSNKLYGPSGIVTRVTNILSLVVGVAAVIMIIIGGVRYVLSSGDSQNVEGAKNTIIFALVGLGVATFAQLIVVFIVRRL